MRRRRRLAAALLAGVAACGPTTQGSSDMGTTAGDGATVDVATARSRADGPVVVEGHVLVEDGEALLSSVLAESYPPQPGPETLPVAGLRLDRLGDVESAEGVTWTPAPVVLVGRLDGGVLVVGEDGS